MTPRRRSCVSFCVGWRTHRCTQSDAEPASRAQSAHARKQGAKRGSPRRARTAPRGSCRRARAAPARQSPRQQARRGCEAPNPGATGRSPRLRTRGSGCAPPPAGGVGGAAVKADAFSVRCEFGGRIRLCGEGERGGVVPGAKQPRAFSAFQSARACASALPSAPTHTAHAAGAAAVGAVDPAPASAAEPCARARQSALAARAASAAASPSTLGAGPVAVMTMSPGSGRTGKANLVGRNEGTTSSKVTAEHNAGLRPYSRAHQYKKEYCFKSGKLTSRNWLSRDGFAAAAPEEMASTRRPGEASRRTHSDDQALARASELESRAFGRSAGAAHRRRRPSLRPCRRL